MSIGFQDIEYQINDISSDADFLTSTNCYTKDECFRYESFTKTDKPVFIMEFNSTLNADTDKLDMITSHASALLCIFLKPKIKMIRRRFFVSVSHPVHMSGL